MTTVAALYVARNGCYFNLPDVEPWDEQKDARLYAGPHPVVAHPPCERWGRYAAGGPSHHGKFTPGADGCCFAAALASVLKWGGVLEHPSGSAAWKTYGLRPPPVSGGWIKADDQGRYGEHGNWTLARGTYKTNRLTHPKSTAEGDTMPKTIPAPTDSTLFTSSTTPATATPPPAAAPAPVLTTATFITDPTMPAVEPVKEKKTRAPRTPAAQVEPILSDVAIRYLADTIGEALHRLAGAIEFNARAASALGAAVAPIAASMKAELVPVAPVAPVPPTIVDAAIIAPPPTPVAPPKEEPAKVEPPPAAPVPATLDTLRSALLRLSKVKNRDMVVNLLASYGAKVLADVAKGDIAAAQAKAEALCVA